MKAMPRLADVGGHVATVVSAILLAGCGGSTAGPSGSEGGADSTAPSGSGGDAAVESADGAASVDALTGPAPPPLDASTADGFPFAPPPAQVCEAVWMQPDAGSDGVELTNPPAVQLAVDATNDIYLAITYQGGQLVVGDAGPAAAGQGVVVVKLDAACNQLWVRTLEAVGVSNVSNTAIGVDSDSNVTLGGGFQGTVDFGDGFVFNGDADGAPVLSKGYVVRYDANGAVVFRDQFLPAAAVRGELYSAFAGVEDLTVAPDGVSTVLASAYGDVDFGVSAADGGDAQDTQDYDAGTNIAPTRRVLVQLDGQGRVLGIPAAAQDDFQQIASDTDGTLWAWSTLTLDGGSLPPGLASFGPDGGVEAPFLVHLSPSADPLWLQSLPQGFSSVTVGAPGAVVLAYPGSQDPVPSNQVELQAFSADGGSPWSRTTTLPAATSLLGGAPLAVALDGTIFVGGMDLGTMNGAPDAAFTAPVIRYATADSTGRFVSQTVWSDGQPSDLRALAVDGAGHLIVAGSTSLPFAASLSRFFVVKLAPRQGGDF
jgi:hypothetical protein